MVFLLKSEANCCSSTAYNQLNSIGNTCCYLHRGGEAPRVLSGCHDEAVHVWLPQILKVQFLGKLHNARCWPNVECPGPLSLSLQSVPDFPVCKRLGLHRDDARNNTSLVRAVLIDSQWDVLLYLMKIYSNKPL